MIAFQPFDEDYDLDLDLDMMFRMAVTDMIWDNFFKAYNFYLTNFEQHLENKFDEGVQFIQEKELPISIRMAILKSTILSQATAQDIAHFVSDGAPMRALLTHNIKRQGIKNLLRQQYFSMYEA